MMTESIKRVRIAAVVLIAAGAAGCDDFLSVQDPGRFTDEALNAPSALNAVANGVEGDMWAVYDDFATFGGLMTDELQHTGTWGQWEDMDQGRIGPAIGTDNNVHRNLMWARTAAQKAQERFATVMADSAERTELMARVVATEAWLNLLMGMHACESPREALGEPVPDSEMFNLSIPIFTRAITIAKAANSADYERFATAGRARANLFAGNLDAALADAQTIPDTWVYTAKFSETAISNSIVSFAHHTRLKAGGLDPINQPKVDQQANAMRDPFSNQVDQRLVFTRQGRGADNVKNFFNQEKFKALSDDVRMASGWEMRLIEAEVQMKKGNLSGAVEAINRVRANAGLTPHNAAGATAAQVQQYLLWERFAQLYLEGHRMHDLARFNQVTAVMGPGRAVKFAMDTNELMFNPHVGGNTSGRCPAKS